MRYTIVLAILLAGLNQSAAAADEPKSFKWSKEQFDLVASGDVKTGKKLAKQFRCKKCHNADGISDDPDIPSIAGQRATYIYKQLRDFKSGHREDSDMRKVARKMSDEQMAHIGTWYSQLEPAPMVGGKPLLVVKNCDSCHDKDLVEEDDHIEVAPVLAGQIRPYLERSMMSFRDAARGNDLFQRMQSVTHKLTEDEIKQLARYYGAEALEEE